MLVLIKSNKMLNNVERMLYPGHTELEFISKQQIYIYNVCMVLFKECLELNGMGVYISW